MKFSSLFVPRYYLNIMLMPYVVIRNQFHGWIFDTYFSYFYLDDCKFLIPKEITSRAYRGARFIYSNYEEDERSLLNYIDPHSCLLELGGNIGILSCIINKRLVKPSQHLVIEANPSLIQTLQDNRQLNNCSFKIENALISNSNSFYINQGAINASSAVKRKGKEITTPLANIKNLEMKYRLKFDTALIDIEGSEIDFIKENIKFLSRVKTIMIEFHPQITSTIAIQESYKQLKKMHFRLVKRVGLVELWKRKLN